MTSSRTRHAFSPSPSTLGEGRGEGFLALLAVLFALVASTVAPAAEPAPAAFERGLPARPDYFPIAVWLQAPKDAPKYKAIGVNLYVGLWNGPTEEQITALEQAQMPVICDLNAWARQHLDRRIIVGWMHGDEPDNAQPLPGGKGWGPPIPPAKIVEDYERLRKLDPSRPVLLNLGQAVAWDNWHGRGVRSRHPEDYPLYARGGDILSFDIYPVTHESPEVKGRLWYVGQGVQRLRQWSGDDKPVWACIESTHIGNPNVKPTPEQTRAMAWMALIHGARGIIYFSHQFKPTFIEAGILADEKMAEGVKRINAEIMELAPALNSPTLPDAAAVASSDASTPIHILNKMHEGRLHIFAIGMRETPTKGRFLIPRQEGRRTVTVIGENRTIEMVDGKFEDSFDGYGVHLYRVALP